MITYDFDCDYGTTTGSSIWTQYESYKTSSSTNCLTIKYGYSNEETASTWYPTIKYGYSDSTTTVDYWNWKKATRVVRYSTSARTSSIILDSCCQQQLPSPTDRLKEIIRNRQAPAFHRSRNHLEMPSDIRETRARETLRRVLGEQKFRSFLKNGFVSVKAKSGLVYQIFPGHDITKVYKDGVLTERLCVVLKGQFPPTDSLIMRYLIILNDEQDFRKHAISHRISSPSAPKQIDQRPLTEIFKELKVA